MGKKKKVDVEEPSLDYRTALIDCIVQKLYRMDVPTLREAYTAVAAIMDKLKRQKG